MISVKCTGDFKKTEGFLGEIKERRYLRKLSKYGQMGVDALAAATPVDTGLTSQCWGYTIEEGTGFYRIVWTNSNLGQGWAPIALLLQYGHGTRNGGWVEGRDYINPAMRSVFDNIADAAWEEVTRA